jgi:hypothetical protein
MIAHHGAAADCCDAGFDWADDPLWVKTSNALIKHKLSALSPKADIRDAMFTRAAQVRPLTRTEHIARARRCPRRRLAAREANRPCSAGIRTLVKPDRLDREKRKLQWSRRGQGAGSDQNGIDKVDHGQSGI